MAVHAEKFTRKREAAIAALLSCSTIGAAARKAKVSERTLYRWLEESNFAAEYKRARARVLDRVMVRLERKATDAVDTLGRNMSPKAPPTQQVQAARAVLDHTLKIRHQHEHSGPDGGPIPVGGIVLTPEHLDELDEEDLVDLERIVRKLTQSVCRPGPEQEDHTGGEER